MFRGIVWILGVLLIAGGCWWLYNRANGREVSTSGDVFLHGTPDSKDPQESTAANDETPAPAPLPQQAAPTVAPQSTTPQPAPAPIAQFNRTQPSSALP